MFDLFHECIFRVEKNKRSENGMSMYTLSIHIRQVQQQQRERLPKNVAIGDLILRARKKGVQKFYKT